MAGGRDRAGSAAAAATRDFLVGVFRGGDPRQKQQRPRGETTARELVDLAAARIDHDLRDDPETRLELLDLTATIYLYLDETEEARRMVRLEVEAAEQLLPPADPRLLDAMLFEIWSDLQAADRQEAAAHLEKLDQRLRDNGLDGSRHRAEYLLAMGDLAQLAGDPAARERALREARAAFEKVAPEETGYAATLANLGELAFGRDQLDEALDLYGQALAAAEKRPEAELEKARYGSRRGRILLELGRRAEAKEALEKARERFAETLGEGHLTAWQATAALARIHCEEGDLEKAESLFASMPKKARKPAPANATAAPKPKSSKPSAWPPLPGRQDQAATLLEKAIQQLQGKAEYAADLRRAEAALQELSRRRRAGGPAARG